MNNNIDIKVIRKNLGETAKLFDPNKPTYQMINECANNENLTSEEITEKLSAIAETKEYPMELRNYFYKTMQDLTYLDNQDKEIEKLQDDIIKENEQLMIEMQKRNVHYYEPLEFKNNYQNLSYNEKAEYIEELKQDLENFKNKNYALNNKEKKSGEGFSEETTKEMQSNEPSLKKSEEDINNINEDIQKTKYKENPSIEEVERYYENMEKNQTEKSTLNVEVEYKDDGNAEIRLGFKGTEVNEKYQMITYNYTNMEEFNKVLDNIIKKHTNGGEIKIEQSQGSLESKNSYDETLSIEGNKNEIQNASIKINKENKKYIDESDNYINNNQRTNNPKVLVRKKDYNNGIAETNIYILLCILVFLIIITILIITL